jgi:hypothetical protein
MSMRCEFGGEREKGEEWVGLWEGGCGESKRRGEKMTGGSHVWVVGMKKRNK